MVHNSKQDEREELYAEIRDLHATKSSDQTQQGTTYTLGCLELGKLIATGCNAAVYEARLTTADSNPSVPQDGLPATETIATLEEADSDIDILDTEDEEPCPSMFHPQEEESDIDIVDEEEIMTTEDVKGSVDEKEAQVSPTVPRRERSPGLVVEDDSLSFSIIEENSLSSINDEQSLSFNIDDEGSLSSNSFDEDRLSDVLVIDEDGCLSDGYTFDDGSDSDSATCDPVFEDRGENSMQELIFNLLPIDPGGNMEEKDLRETTLPDFDLAVKMMFNYDAESNAETILRAMDKEVVPLASSADHLQADQWRNGNHVKKKAWPPHPNIVRMYGLFVSEVPDVPDNVDHYPAALPARIHPEGLGRNMTLFLVMKRYTCTLTDYLTRETPTMTTRCFLLCQLLEGVAFLRQRNVAHRDIKSDNLLVDLTTGSEWPLLVISDFGCCLNEGTLQIPYVTSEINKGGNSALMAPEIACAEAGRRSVLDYRKSDVWAAGALVYEIMGCPNPFYRCKLRPARLDSRTYREEDLPDLPDEVPDVVKNLTRNLLSRDRAQRLSAAVAATVLQLHLWCMSGNNNNSNNNIGIKEVQNRVVNLAVQTRLKRRGRQETPNFPDSMKQVFLSRISYQDLESALQFVQAE